MVHGAQDATHLVVVVQGESSETSSWQMISTAAFKGLYNSIYFGPNGTYSETATLFWSILQTRSCCLSFISRSWNETAKQCPGRSLTEWYSFSVWNTQRRGCVQIQGPVPESGSRNGISAGGQATTGCRCDAALLSQRTVEATPDEPQAESME